MIWALQTNGGYNIWHLIIINITADDVSDESLYGCSYTAAVLTVGDETQSVKLLSFTFVSLTGIKLTGGANEYENMLFMADSGSENEARAANSTLRFIKQNHANKQAS